MERIWKGNESIYSIVTKVNVLAKDAGDELFMSVCFPYPLALK